MDLDPIYIDVPPIWLNQSRWKAYQDCDRLFAWPYLQGLEPDRKKGYFELGSAVHAAQVAAHEAGGTPEAFAAATEAAKRAFEKGMEGPRLPGDEEEIQKGLDIIAKLLPAYHQHYAKQGAGSLWKPLGMELAFCVEVGEGTNVWLVGRIDNLVTFMGGLWLVDYKTMGRLDLRDFIKYEIDIQLTAYIYGGTKQLSLDAQARGEKPVMIRGAIIDGMVKTAIPQFHRELYTRTVEDLREFELEFCQKAWEIASKQAIVRKDRRAYDAYAEKLWDLGQQGGWKTTFPKNTNQCFRYGTCAYRDLCAKDTETRRLAFRQRAPDYVDAAGEKP